MGIAAAVLAVIGGLSTIMGVLDAADIIPQGSGLATVDWTFWLLLATALFLASIVLLVWHRNNMD